MRIRTPAGAGAGNSIRAPDRVLCRAGKWFDTHLGHGRLRLQGDSAERTLRYPAPQQSLRIPTASQRNLTSRQAGTGWSSGITTAMCYETDPAPLSHNVTCLRTAIWPSGHRKQAIHMHSRQRDRQSRLLHQHQCAGHTKILSSAPLGITNRAQCLGTSETYVQNTQDDPCPIKCATLISLWVPPSVRHVTDERLPKIERQRPSACGILGRHRVHFIAKYAGHE